MNGQIRKTHGMPNWVDCGTTDLDAAETFYANVFGWDPERVTASNGEIYSLQRLNGKRVAGIYPLNQEMLEQGVPSHWAVYFEVRDVAAALAAVQLTGGAVVSGPDDEPGVGTFAVIRDPIGAHAMIWSSAPGQSAEMFDEPGAMSWAELFADDPEKAIPFYQAVLESEPETIMAGPNPYTLLKVGGEPLSGVLPKRPEMPDGPATWDIYFCVADVDETTTAVLAAGGKIIAEPFDLPVGARMAVLQDPQGAVFEIINRTNTKSA